MATAQQGQVSAAVLDPSKGRAPPGSMSWRVACRCRYRWAGEAACSSVLEQAAGCWLLAAGCWLLAASCWLLAAGCWLLAAGCWLLAAGCWLLAAGCWLLAAGCWLLAAGCWLLAAFRDPQGTGFRNLWIWKTLKFINFFKFFKCSGYKI